MTGLATLCAACKRLADKRAFHHFVLGVIVFNAVLIGVETSASVMATYGPSLKALNAIIQVIFVAEILIRLAAHAPRVDRFFRDGWNVFDFVIVVASLLPAAGPMATVGRLARVLRVLRLVTAVPELRLIVATMIRSIPSMGHVILLLGLLIYVYAVVGVNFFAAGQPDQFGNLGKACLTLFTILTLEGWADVQAASMQSMPWAWVYYMSFVVIAVFVVINLFIAVVTNNLQAVKTEHTAESDADHVQRELLSSVKDLRDRLERFESMVRAAPAPMPAASAASAASNGHNPPAPPLHA
jgi:voltage-gated sodium channel